MYFIMESVACTLIPYGGNIFREVTCCHPQNPLPPQTTTNKRDNYLYNFLTIK